jgi:hypothetical protein
MDSGGKDSPASMHAQTFFLLLADRRRTAQHHRNSSHMIRRGMRLQHKPFACDDGGSNK